MDSSNKFNVRPWRPKGSLAEMVRFKTGELDKYDHVLSAGDAVNLAVWLVALSGLGRETFDRLWAEVTSCT